MGADQPSPAVHGSKINSKLKFSLEFGPVLAFFAAYIWLRDVTFTFAGRDYAGLVLVTVGFVPLFALSIAALWRLTGRVAAMQIVTLVIVVVFGGLTIWFNDGDFIKMKPTMIYLIFASILGFGLLRGRSYLALVMADAVPLSPKGWMILTRRVTLFFVGLALLNEVMWRGFSETTWVYFKTFGLPVGIFVFFMSQAGLMASEATDRDQPKD